MMVFAKTFGGKDFHSEIEHYNSFKKINQCSNGHYIMYFTKFYKNMVFAEVLFQNERSSNYGESTVIGESLCFCVEFNNCKIEDYSVKTISNN